MTRRPAGTSPSAAILLSAVLLLAGSGSARAQELPPPQDEAPPAPVELRHIPPRFSWDAGLSASYGMLEQFDLSFAYPGFGARAGWGRHFGPHRVGPALAVSFEGPLGVQWANVFEPMVVWDWIHPSGLYLGAAMGPTLSLNVDLSSRGPSEIDFDAAPFAAFRIGFSQPWSLVSRRFWVYVEPKLRVIDGRPSFLASICLGTGMGY